VKHDQALFTLGGLPMEKNTCTAVLPAPMFTVAPQFKQGTHVTLQGAAAAAGE